MFDSTSIRSISVNCSNTPEKSSWHTTGRVWAPDLVAPAAPMNCFTSMVGPLAPAAVPTVGRKLPMCTATGMRASCTSAQNGSSSGRGWSPPLGNAEITTPRWSRSITRLVSSIMSCTPVVGRIAWAIEPAVGVGAELGEPVVVGPHAGELEVTVGAVDLGAEEGDARVQHLEPDAVDVHVGEPGLGVEASRPHRLVGGADGREVEGRHPRGGGEAHRADALAVVERPVVAVVAMDHLRGPVPQGGRHPGRPGVGRLVDVGVAVEDRVVDRRGVLEVLGAVSGLHT